MYGKRFLVRTDHAALTYLQKFVFSSLHPPVLTNVRSSLLQRATSTIRSQPGLGPDTTKHLVSDVGSERRSVKLQGRNTRRLDHPRRAGPEGAPPLKHSGPRVADTGAGRKERRLTSVKGQEEPILKQEGRSFAAGGNPSEHVGSQET